MWILYVVGEPVAPKVYGLGGGVQSGLPSFWSTREYELEVTTSFTQSWPDEEEGMMPSQPQIRVAVSSAIAIFITFLKLLFIMRSL